MDAQRLTFLFLILGLHDRLDCGRSPEISKVTNPSLEETDLFSSLIMFDIFSFHEHGLEGKQFPRKELSLQLGWTRDLEHTSIIYIAVGVFKLSINSTKILFTKI